MSDRFTLYLPAAVSPYSINPGFEVIVVNNRNLLPIFNRANAQVLAVLALDEAIANLLLHSFLRFFGMFQSVSEAFSTWGEKLLKQFDEPAHDFGS